MVKNLRINSRKMKKDKKYKISRIGIGVVALVTSLSIVLSGCGKNDDNYYYIPDSSLNYGTNEYDVLNDPFVKYDENDYSNSQLTVETSAYNEFINYIDGIDTKYNYESYYNVDEALNRYNQVIQNGNATKHSYSIDLLTVDSLVKVVKSNNAVYLKQKEAEYVSSFYEEFSDQELRKYCDIILDVINHYVSQGLVEDINEVKCILGDLKILKRTIITNAYVTDDNCLIISPSMIETLEIKNLDGKQDVVRSTIGHEAVHLLQKGCIDNHKNVYTIGNSYEFEDLNVNPLFYNWFYEGAAEMLANNYMNYKPIVYEYYVNYINSLKLSVVLNKDISVNDLEETTLKNSLDPLFEIFGCKDNDDKKEIINMLFSLDIIETDTEDFINAVNPNMDEQELVKIKRDLKSSVCETMTKYFYTSLATLVKENKIPLNDVFYYITVFEADIDSHIVYSNTEKYNDSIVFIENYLEIQSNFFKFLASSNKYTQEEIEEMFDNYGLKNSKGEENFELSYLNKDKVLFLNKVLNSVYDSSSEQIIDVYRRNSTINVKK